jgi:hypothetical protein
MINSIAIVEDGLIMDDGVIMDCLWMCVESLERRTGEEEYATSLF